MAGKKLKKKKKFLKNLLYSVPLGKFWDEPCEEEG